MIFGIGTDIVETERIGKLAARGRQYLSGIFTDKEIEYCESKSRPSQHFAARYAAKEAMLKALGVGWSDGLSFADIEVLDDDRGRPQLFVHGKADELCHQHGIQQSCISLSHTRESAIAVIILET